jgi:predicted MFS family arabinose efflux permease
MFYQGGPVRTSCPFIISATALIAATYGLSRFGYGLFVPAFNQSFALTPTVTGSISSGSFISYCLAAAVAYRLVASPRLTVLLAGSVAAAGSIGVAVSGSAVVLAVSMLIAGAGAGFASPGLVTLVQERVDSLASTRAQAVVNSGTGFGVVIAGPLALILADQWRTAWWIIAAINAAATIAVLVTGKLPRTKTVTAERRAFRLDELKPLRLASVAALLAGVSSAAVWTFGRSLVTTEGHMSESEATTFWVCLGTAGIAGAFSGDLVTKWGLRAGWTTTAALMGLATLVIGVLPSNVISVYAGGAVFGASYIALSGVLIAWATDALPERAAAGTAALFITLALGQATGAFLIGALLDATNPISAFVIASVIAGIGLIPATRRATPLTRNSPHVR